MAYRRAARFSWLGLLPRRPLGVLRRLVAAVVAVRDACRVAGGPPGRPQRAVAGGRRRLFPSGLRADRHDHDERLHLRRAAHRVARATPPGHRQQRRHRCDPARPTAPAPRWCAQRPARPVQAGSAACGAGTAAARRLLSLQQILQSAAADRVEPGRAVRNRWRRHAQTPDGRARLPCHAPDHRRQRSDPSRHCRGNQSRRRSGARGSGRRARPRHDRERADRAWFRCPACPAPSGSAPI